MRLIGSDDLIAEIKACDPGWKIPPTPAVKYDTIEKDTRVTASVEVNVKYLVRKCEKVSICRCQLGCKRDFQH